jgi:hypothetical protein
MTQQSPTSPSEYDLKIDTQVEKFVETKQKLTYFLVTASVAVVAFVVDFGVKNRATLGIAMLLILYSCLSGLVTAGSALLNLHLEISSYQLHLRFRYQRKNWSDLKPEEQSKWTKLNSMAAFFLKSAFIFLFLQIGLAILSFIRFLILPGATH